MSSPRPIPVRYFEMFIAEQQMVCGGRGAQRPRTTSRSPRRSLPSSPARTTSSGWLPTRRANIRLSGSHAGVEIGPDGPSQMALEDLAMMRAVHGATVLYPSDAASTAALVREMADRPGISYLRTTRGSYPVLYDSAEAFPVGGSEVLRSGPDNAVTFIGAGVTLHDCLAAADVLAGEGIRPGCWTCTPSRRSTLRRWTRPGPPPAGAWSWPRTAPGGRARQRGDRCPAGGRPSRSRWPIWASASCLVPVPG